MQLNSHSVKVKAETEPGGDETTATPGALSRALTQQEVDDVGTGF